MIWEVIGLGFLLSLDNFRVAIVLGTVPFGPRRAVQIALTFGFWDVVMPLVGLTLGSYVGDVIGPFAEYVGSAVLGAYGVFLLVGAMRKPESEKLDHPWALFGIPFSLSLDNLVAGTSLGLLGFSPVFSSIVFGVITAVMSLIGLQLGRYAACLVHIRSDLLSGVALIAAAIALPILFG